MGMLNPGDHVEHVKYGTGRVALDNGDTVLVRFEHGYEECEKTDLVIRVTPLQAIQTRTWHPPQQVIAKTQAAAIQSANDLWGVFALSRITLLPHQLWVCRRVVERWPSRWLIADDVGLGKTIEGGLILSSLLSRGAARRILIIAPASLVLQWQIRLRTMFDIRCSIYTTEADQPRADFWNVHDQVIVSLQTIRFDHKDRVKRLLESDSWDLLFVDEAHHLNADEKGGGTLGFDLVQQLVRRDKVKGMVFFTGTPHRGKNFGFLSLLSLLDKSIDPQRDLGRQLDKLPAVMIRNNKQNVTDLRGNKLFQPPLVTSETYTYSPTEAAFYAKLTEFILTGKAYAGSLSTQQGLVVILVLITMQKLASSSVAAIRRALRGRLNRIQDRQQQLAQVERRLEQYRELEAMGDIDEVSRLEEELIELSYTVHLMEDEIPRLHELLEAADMVIEETKLNKIVSVLQTGFEGRSVLFFTEYKATQAKLMSVLIRHFGDGCVTFINGDNRIEEVVNSKGHEMTLTEGRDEAVRRFLAGDVRFLVSTEAGGEGIDLQEQCHTLIHVDLPWNPMRLHQRVGRLNRYGQKHQVEVLTMRNPDTVESRIWDKLNAKIDSIKLALNQVMDEPEDLLQLVLGMTSPTLYTDIFAGAEAVPHERLNDWFDQRTAQFGGRDVIQTVRELVGNAARFDYQQVSDQLPQVDLDALAPFFTTMLQLNNRRPRSDEKGLSFKTPEAWLEDKAMLDSYDGMVFDRSVGGRSAAARVLGVGSRLVNAALQQARSYPVSVTAFPESDLPMPLVVFRIYDRITGGTFAQSVTAGVKFDPKTMTAAAVLPDWLLLLELNKLAENRSARATEPQATAVEPEAVTATVAAAQKALEQYLDRFGLPYTRPEIELLAVLWSHP